MSQLSPSAEQLLQTMRWHAAKATKGTVISSTSVPRAQHTDLVSIRNYLNLQLHDRANAATPDVPHDAYDVDIARSNHVVSVVPEGSTSFQIRITGASVAEFRDILGETLATNLTASPTAPARHT